MPKANFGTKLGLYRYKIGFIGPLIQLEHKKLFQDESFAQYIQFEGILKVSYNFIAMKMLFQF